MTARTLQVRLRVLEEVAAPALLLLTDMEPTGVPDPILDFLRDGVARMNTDPDMTVSAVSPDLIQPGETAEIDLILCSPDAMRELFEMAPNVLGVCLFNTPYDDPFQDGTPHARAYRIAIPFDPEVVMGKIRDAVADIDGEVDEADLVHGAMGWLATLTHEVHHVLWLAGNGSFNSPADLDAMEAEIGHDLFDFITGYGVRPVLIEGAEIEPEDAEDATELLEMMVEEHGRRMAERVFRDDLGPERFLALLTDHVCEKDKRNENSLEMTL